MKVRGRNETFLFIRQNLNFKCLSPRNAEARRQIPNFVVQTFAKDFISFSCNVCILILPQMGGEGYLKALVYASQSLYTL